jgi:hypothetical protein
MRSSEGNLHFIPLAISMYCDGWLEVLKYGIRKPRETRSTRELLLLSNDSVNNHNRGIIEDIDS